MGVVLELSSPGMQDAGETWKVRTDEPLVFGKPFESERRGVEQGLVGDTLVRADEGPQGVRDGEGDEEVWPGEQFVQVALKPLLGLMVLTLWTVSVATGMIDAVFFSTAWALIEAMSIVPALAVLDSADDLAV